MTVMGGSQTIGEAAAPPLGACEIPLLDRDGNVRAVALVDADVFAEWGHKRWHMNRYGDVCRQEGGRRARVGLRLGRVVLGLDDPDLEADHINRNKLDNRRENLRPVTRLQNKQNLNAYKGSSSRYRGVSWDKARQRWQARCKVGGKVHHLGRFVREVEAAEAAAAARRDLMPYSNN